MIYRFWWGITQSWLNFAEVFLLWRCIISLNLNIQRGGATEPYLAVLDFTE
jgi:hypothetical protein